MRRPPSPPPSRCFASSPGRRRHAPFVSITFDQPMVPVGTVGQVTATTCRDIFAGDPRALAVDRHQDAALRRGDPSTACRWPRTTPSPCRPARRRRMARAGAAVRGRSRLLRSRCSPSSPGRQGQPLQPVFVATFDQRVDPGPCSATSRSRPAARSTPSASRRRTRSRPRPPRRRRRWRSPGRVGRSGRPIRWRRSASPYVAAGTPSAEGDRLTDAPRHTRPAPSIRSAVTGVRCWQSPCRPGDDFDFEFNNQIDTELFDPAAITIEPEIPGAMIAQYGDDRRCGARPRPTPPTNHVPRDMADMFGQTLGQDQEQTIAVGDPLPFLQQFTSPFTTADPFSDRRRCRSARSVTSNCT